MTAADLLSELGSSRTDLARLVRAAVSRSHPYVVVSARAVKAWGEREPDTWARVSVWLTAYGKIIVEV